MKKSFLDLFKRGGTTAPENPTERKVQATVNTDFAKGISLEEKFEDMFPGEIPDEIRYYDIHGNEVEKK